MPNKENVSTAWDACLLEKVSEENFLENLRHRYQRDQIYTYIGTSIVAINPYKPLSIYTPDLVKNYAIKGLFHLPPHIYGLSNFVHEWTTDFNEDQNIVTTGECGSGKTESSRMVVHFLTNVAEFKRAKLNSSLLKLCRQQQRMGRNSNVSSTPNSRNTTPKHQKQQIKGCSAIATVSCIKSAHNLDVKHTKGAIKKCSHEKVVDFDFSNRRSSEILPNTNSMKCVKHAVHANIHFSKSFEENSNQQAITKSCTKHLSSSSPYNPATKCDTIINTDLTFDNLVPSTSTSSSSQTLPKYVPIVDHMGNRMTNSIGGSGTLSSGDYQVPKHQYHHCNCLDAKSPDSKFLKPSLKTSNCCATEVVTYGEASFPYGPMRSRSNEAIPDRYFGQSTQCLATKTNNGRDMWKVLRAGSRSGFYMDDPLELQRARDRVEQADVVLEALGNATTLKNENSSRFEMSLEVISLTSRLTGFIQGERNFHIFYQLLYGADLHFLKSLKLLRNIDKYELLHDTMATEDDKTNFTFTKKSLEILGLSSDEILSIFKVIAVVLKLGNLSFIPTTNIDGTEGCEVSDEYELNEISQLLCIEEQILLNCLTKSGPNWSQLDNGSELDAFNATKLKYSLCRTLYGRLFTYVVNRINESLKDSTLPPNCFQIHHYCGPVTYTAVNFAEKNQDFLPKHISSGMYQSKLLIMQYLFPEGNPKKSSKKPTSISSNLRTSLQGLLQNLGQRRNHYVFCLRPNEFKEPHAFELPLVQHQVRYLSLIPLTNLWRTGHYFSLSHTKFYTRYKLLSNHTWPNFSSGPIVEAIAIIIRSVPLPAAEFTIGSKKLFIRSPRTVYELEEFRKTRLHFLAILIQKTFRCYAKRKFFLRLRQSQITIATTWRTWRAREEYRIIKYKKQVEWAIGVIQRHHFQWKRREFLQSLLIRLPANSLSPLCNEWPSAPPFLQETSMLLRQIYHRWRCYKYRISFDQTSRNRMREKVTASIIFRDRKASYAKSVSHPFHGDYVRLRQNVQWKKICMDTNDQYVVFADIINKITRSSGKFVPVLLVLSTNSMLLLDQRTLQIKYRIPASEIYRMSLSPYLDDIAVFHVKASEFGRKKGDFVFQTGHILEIVTKLFLVVQNATTRPPEVHISSEFEANFGQQTVILTFRCGGSELTYTQPKVTRKGNRMEVILT
uniref:CSON002516 protein n=1 Tax=Culicoides sonorensis TaxID=179676 RepID=A0A336LWW2_CULSO